jgi:hypothetical protein
MADLQKKTNKLFGNVAVFKLTCLGTTVTNRKPTGMGKCLILSSSEQMDAAHCSETSVTTE